ncbi:MAG: hypothetical protein KF841_00865 [Phycisphaerae bacterium]|nr:hypothetical protein [Phycisphaerae bacterium]
MDFLTPSSDEASLPTIKLRVDRTRVLAGLIWRGASAACIIGLLAVWDVRWRLLWQNDFSQFFARATIFLFGAAVALTLALAALKRLLLCLWNADLSITLSPDGLRMHLGPYGQFEFDIAGLRFETDREIDEETFDLLPDDSFTPRIESVSDGRELAEAIGQFTGVDAEQLAGLLRPYIRQAIRRKRPANQRDS